MERIKQLDGLRAIAVSLVVLGHSSSSNPETFPRWASVLFSGTLGVLIFFVLSGYLITSALIHEKAKTGSISLFSFYIKRAIRILPASYAYLSMVAALSFAGLVSVSKMQLGLGFAHIWNYGVFMLPEGEPLQGYKALGHFWSLAVEEQFYWFWPLMILTLRRGFTPFLLAVILLSPLLRVLHYLFLPAVRGQLNMMFHTGADPLAMGALLAVQQDRIKRWLQRIPTVWLNIPVAFFFFLAPFIEEMVGGPWSITYGKTVEILAAALIILTMVHRSEHWLSRIAVLRPFQFVGAISFSLYLWQQVFCVEGSILPLGPGYAIAASLLAASASYYLVERPTQKLRGPLLGLVRKPRYSTSAAST